MIRRSTSLLVLLFLAAWLATGCSSADDDTDLAAPDELPSASVGGDGSTDTTSDAPASGDPALGPDLQRVTGTVDGGTIRGVLDGPATLPLTLQVASRGGGNGAVFTGVTVDGSPATLVWDGGRSLSLEGDDDGNLRLGTDQFRVDGGRLIAVLGDGAHVLGPGRYRLSGPVAVGDGTGLARPSDLTSFVAADGSLLTASGAAEAVLPPLEWLVLGPGSLDLTGTLQVQTADGSTSSGHVVLPAGSFEVTLRPADGGLQIDARTDRP